MTSHPSQTNRRSRQQHRGYRVVSSISGRVRFLDKGPVPRAHRA